MAVEIFHNKFDDTHIQKINPSNPAIDINQPRWDPKKLGQTRAQNPWKRTKINIKTSLPYPCKSTFTI